MRPASAPPTATVAVDEAAHGKQPGHVAVLDGMRGLAVLLVMVHHFAYGSSGVSLPARLFVDFADGGWIGVDLFFVLSGYLITGILLATKSKPHPGHGLIGVSVLTGGVGRLDPDDRLGPLDIGKDRPGVAGHQRGHGGFERGIRFVAILVQVRKGERHLRVSLPRWGV